MSDSSITVGHVTRDMSIGTVYLLHFEREVRPGMQHYTGFTMDLQNRLRQHREADGSKLTREACRLGIAFEVAAVWRDVPRVVERRVKLDTLHLCTICNGPGHAGRPAVALMAGRESA